MSLGVDFTAENICIIILWKEWFGKRTREEGIGLPNLTKTNQAGHHIQHPQGCECSEMFYCGADFPQPDRSIPQDYWFSRTGDFFPPGDMSQFSLVSSFLEEHVLTWERVEHLLGHVFPYPSSVPDFSTEGLQCYGQKEKTKPCRKE